MPLAKGGDPERIVAARSLQRTLRLLLGLLPRLGLFAESAELLRRAAEMERSQTVLPGAVTEFDQLLKVPTRRSPNASSSRVPSGRRSRRPTLRTTRPTPS